MKKSELDKARKDLVRMTGFHHALASWRDIMAEKQEHRVKVWQQSKDIRLLKKYGRNPDEIIK